MWQSKRKFHLITDTGSDLKELLKLFEYRCFLLVTPDPISGNKQLPQCFDTGTQISELCGSSKTWLCVCTKHSILTFIAVNSMFVKKKVGRCDAFSPRLGKLSWRSNRWIQQVETLNYETLLPSTGQNW